MTWRARLTAALVAVLFVVGSCPNSAASPAPPVARQALGAGVDFGVQAVREDDLVPLVHSGPRVTAHARYFGRMGFGLALAEARLGPAFVRGRYGEEGLTLHWSVRAAALFTLSERRGTLSALGPALAWESESFYLEDWDDAHAYWIGTRWLGPRVHVLRQVSTNYRLDAEAELGLVGLLSRPPAYRQQKQETSDDVWPVLSQPSREPRFATFLDFQAMRASLDLLRSAPGGQAPRGLGFGIQLAFTRASTFGSPPTPPAGSFETALRISYLWSL